MIQHFLESLPNSFLFVAISGKISNIDNWYIDIGYLQKDSSFS